MTLLEIGHGETVQSIQEEVGWELHVASNVREMVPPSANELTVIREQLDPQGLYR